MMSSTETLFFSKKVIKKYSLCFLFFQLSIDCCPTYSVIQDLLRNEKKILFSANNKKNGPNFFEMQLNNKKGRKKKWEMVKNGQASQEMGFTTKRKSQFCVKGLEVEDIFLLHIHISWIMFSQACLIPDVRNIWIRLIYYLDCKRLDNR